MAQVGKPAGKKKVEKLYPNWPQNPDPSFWNKEKKFAYTDGRCCICESKKRGLIEDLIQHPDINDMDVLRWINHHNLMHKQISRMPVVYHRTKHMGIVHSIRKGQKKDISKKAKTAALAKMEKMEVPSFLKLIVKKAGVGIITGQYDPTVGEGLSAAKILISAPKEMEAARYYAELTEMRRKKREEIEEVEHEPVEGLPGASEQV